MDELITKQQAIDALKQQADTMSGWSERYAEQRKGILTAVNIVDDLPPAQPAELETLIKALEKEHRKLRETQKALPEIIYCKDCAKHNKGVGDFEVLPDGRRSWIWKDRACPLVSWRGKAQEHAFDYQYCVFAERRTDERSD